MELKFGDGVANSKLPKIPPLSEDPDSPLLQWAHFLAGSLPERYTTSESLDPGVKLAMNRLKALSKDEKARRLAQQRSIAARMHYETMCASRDEGLEIGRAQGIEQGQASLLFQLLSKRFGPLPESARETLRSASSDQLMAWSLRVLEAKSLEDVFNA